MAHTSPSQTDKTKEQAHLGRWSGQELKELLRVAAESADTSDRIALISRQFLGVPYQESTLTGSCETREVLVINLAAVDCFTYIDYVEAMRSSRSFEQFREQLKRIRYRSGQVTYDNRRHFFTDWLSLRRVRDMTKPIGGNSVMTTKKVLNRKSDGSYFLPGIKPVVRTINYVPVGHMEAYTLERLRTGDYVGIYTETAGLDVSHVGIILRDEKAICLRHASSIAGKVVDQDFKQYIAGKPGIVVLRPGP